MKVFGKGMCEGRAQRRLLSEDLHELTVDDIATPGAEGQALLSGGSSDGAPGDRYCTVPSGDISLDGEDEEDPDLSYRSLDDTDSSSEANDFYDAIYNIGVTESHDKAALYGRMMHYYAERAGTIGRPPAGRSKSVLWYMLLILISNPIIGIYTLAHFSNWGAWVTGGVTVVDAPAGQLYRLPLPAGAAAPASSPWSRSRGAAGPGPNAGTTAGTVGDPDDAHLVLNREEFEALSGVAVSFSRKVRWYACYEVFGELVFAFVSLALLCASGMCCSNGRLRVQSMVPLIGLLYTVIYKILAMYILAISCKIMFFYLVASHPDSVRKLPAVVLRMLALKGTDLSSSAQRVAMSQLLLLDPSAHKWVVLYCLENVYITITDSVEAVQALWRIFVRALRKLLRRLRRQQELVYFTMSSTTDAAHALEPHGVPSCSYILLDSLLNKAAAPEETYIHALYNNAVPDVGTYMDNIDIEQYKDGVARMGPKIMSQLRNKEAFRGDCPSS